MDSNHFGHRYGSSGGGNPRAYYEPERRSPTPLLWLGIIFVPFVFGWTLLEKGYSTGSRWLGFGWMTIIAVTVINAVSHPDQIQQAANVPAQQTRTNKPPLSQQTDASQDSTPDSTPTYSEAEAQHDREQYCWNHPNSFGHSFMCSDIPNPPNAVIVVVPSDDDNDDN